MTTIAWRLTKRRAFFVPTESTSHQKKTGSPRMAIPVTFKAYARSISKRSWVKRELRWYIAEILEDDKFPKAKEGEWEIAERYLQNDDVWQEYDLEAFKELWQLFEDERRWYKEQVLTGRYAEMKARIKTELARKKANGL